MSHCHIAFGITILLVANFSGIGSALQCYTCDSLETPECATNPSDQLEVVDCPAKDSECVMAVLDDQITYRGCRSDIVISDDCKSCKNATCTEDRCNVEVFPMDRLRCYKCAGKDCLVAPEEHRPCQFYDMYEMCYTDVIDETDAIRGCVSDSDYDAGMYSKFCHSGDGCNGDPAVSTFTCFSCDSEFDDNCKYGEEVDFFCEMNMTDVCSINVLLGRWETCYTYQKGERVRRGCSRLDPEYVMQSQYISTCWNSNCNDRCIDNRKCYTCDAATDESCEGNVTSLTLKECTPQASSCYTCKNNNLLTRGCGDDILNDTCLSCWNKNGCNTEMIRSCYSCNSEADKNCATWITEPTQDVVMCETNCIVKIKDMHTVRGCKTSSLLCGPNDDTCKECDGDKCNGDIYPANRQLCHLCDEADSSCDAWQEDTYLGACHLYDPKDRCYLYDTGKNKMVRGCTSDIRYLSCEERGDEICKVCDDAGCNDRGLRKLTSLSCFKCEEQDIGCAWTQWISQISISYFLYYQQPGCFTQILSNGTVIRGFINQKNACDEDDESCEICRYDKCNGEKKVYQKCVQCSGKIGESDCADNAQNMEATVCESEIQYYENRGCYVKRTNNSHVTRGCLTELTSFDVDSCEKSRSCLICLDQSCNTQPAPSSAVRLSEFSIFCALLLAFKMFLC